MPFTPVTIGGSSGMGMGLSEAQVDARIRNALNIQNGKVAIGDGAGGVTDSLLSQSGGVIQLGRENTMIERPGRTTSFTASGTAIARQPSFVASRNYEQVNGIGVWAQARPGESTVTFNVTEIRIRNGGTSSSTISERIAVNRGEMTLPASNSTGQIRNYALDDFEIPSGAFVDFEMEFIDGVFFGLTSAPGIVAPELTVRFVTNNPLVSEGTRLRRRYQRMVNSSTVRQGRSQTVQIESFAEAEAENPSRVLTLTNDGGGADTVNDQWGDGAGPWVPNSGSGASATGGYFDMSRVLEGENLNVSLFFNILGMVSQTAFSCRARWEQQNGSLIRREFLSDVVVGTDFRLNGSLENITFNIRKPAGEINRSAKVFIEYYITFYVNFINTEISVLGGNQYA